VSTVAEYEKCAALGHAMETTSPGPQYHRTGEKTIFLSCTRCGTERYLDIDAAGAIWGSKYHQSPGYREFLDKHHGSRANYRLMVEGRRKKRRRLKVAG
jgi:hypothetical protein